MKKKVLSPADKAIHLGKSNNYLKKAHDCLVKAGDFGKFGVDDDIYQAFHRIEDFIDNACRNLEKF